MGKDTGVVREELRERLGRMARELGREVYPEGLGRGEKFSDLEELAGVLGDEIARRFIETQVSGQAEEWPDDELGECPECGGPARKAPDQPRVLITTRGDVAWNERVGHCARCRRAFFPSESRVGN